MSDEPAPKGGWPCKRRDAHGPHPMTKKQMRKQAKREGWKGIRYPWCKGVKAHPLTMIGRND